MIPRGVGPRLALVAFALGALALFSQPHRGPFVRLDARELGLVAGQQADRVTPAELASWIVAGRSDYRLLDLRSPEAYATYHIPGAESVPLVKLADYPLRPNEKIVVYSDGGVRGAQAWVLLRALGFRSVYALAAGLQGWKDDVLYPSAPAGDDAQAKSDFARAAAVAAYFGGQARATAGTAAAAPLPALPKLQAPAASAVVPAAPRDKKREGC